MKKNDGTYNEQESLLHCSPQEETRFQTQIQGHSAPISAKIDKYFFGKVLLKKLKEIVK